ncbi:MAG: hypothetical protein LBL24_07425 [Bacteroidales bacterium]|nr:hypothetical protein [Bacteroidales bacterium]
MDFEKEAIDCILQYNPEAEITNRTEFPGLACKAVYVPGKNIVFHLIPVPFAGLQNLSPTYFQEKSLEYASLGIQLVHLWQDYWVTGQETVHSRIAAFSGSSIRIHARQAKVQRITKDDMRCFFTVNHLQGPVNARYNYGLYAGGQLVAAASFSAGRTVTRNGVAGRSFELLRYASLLHHRVVGGFGKLIACFIEEAQPDDIMTYADLDWASGKSYRALNFEQTAVTPPQMFWIHPADMIRYYPHRLPSHLTDEFKRRGRHGNIGDFLKDMGYIKIYNAGNLKYLLIRGY